MEIALLYSFHELIHAHHSPGLGCSLFQDMVRPPCRHHVCSFFIPRTEELHRHWRIRPGLGAQVGHPQSYGACPSGYVQTSGSCFAGGACLIGTSLFSLCGGMFAGTSALLPPICSRNFCWKRFPDFLTQLYPVLPLLSFLVGSVLPCLLAKLAVSWLGLRPIHLWRNSLSNASSHIAQVSPVTSNVIQPCLRLATIPVRPCLIDCIEHFTPSHTHQACTVYSGSVTFSTPTCGL